MSLLEESPNPGVSTTVISCPVPSHFPVPIFVSLVVYVYPLPTGNVHTSFGQRVTANQNVGQGTLTSPSGSDYQDPGVRMVRLTAHDGSGGVREDHEEVEENGSLLYE